MADNRLEKIDTSQTDSNSESVKIKKLKLNNFKFFYHDFNFDINGKNILLYGENGSGKSSIYKALELLTKEDFSDFETNKNIFAADSDEGLSVEFTFTDDTQISFEDNEAQIPDNYEFLNGLSIFRPFLDYKRLLKVHYSSDNGKSKINLYSMFRQLLKDYPVKGEKLNDINDVIKYFEELKNILHMDLIDEINRFLKIYFKADILLNSIDTRTEFDLETDKALPIVNLNMDYYGNQVEKYHVFLNEARLTALAMSIYFVSIKRLMKNIEETNVIKLLVLDDILISLDMSNRIKLLSILKEEFSEYQILFFTHDKELFELYKSKLPEWKKYELYVDDSGYQPGALLKAGTSYLDRAKMYYAQKDYECCAVFLRKALEERIKLYLEPHEQRNKNCVELTLDDAVKKAILKSKKNDLNDLSVLFKKIHDHRKFILNPLTHDEAKNIHTSEMKSALEDIERLKGLIKGKIL